MHGVDDGAGGISLWQFVLGAAALLMTFLTGVWASATHQGELKAKVKSNGETIDSMKRDVAVLQQNQTTGLERLRNLGERVERAEERHDEIREKLGLMAERIAQVPTRDEINQGFSRIAEQVKEEARANRTH